MRFAGARRSTRTLLWAALAAQGMTGCAEQKSAEGKLAEPAQTYAARRADISPSGATVSVAVDGAPEAVAARLISAIAKAAVERDIVVTDEKNAKYLIHGYVSAYPVDGGIAVAYVWDVFDSKRHRTRRMNDALTFKATAESAVQERAAEGPWAFADENALAGIASRSVDDLAAFLAATPEAVAATPKGFQASRSLTLGPDQSTGDQPSKGRPAETMGMVPSQ
jgi:hypothetical protein